MAEVVQVVVQPVRVEGEGEGKGQTFQRRNDLEESVTDGLHLPWFINGGLSAKGDITFIPVRSWALVMPILVTVKICFMAPWSLI